MNEKEFNLQVLAKLVEIANVIFAKLTINIEGTFTAAELWEGKNSLNENIVIDYHGTQFDTYTVEVGTFKCSFTPEKVFYLVWKFEQLCKVRQENKARFTCQLCGRSDRGLNVHHIKYQNDLDYWDYPDELLLTVCPVCHAKIHGKPVPAEKKTKITSVGIKEEELPIKSVFYKSLFWNNELTANDKIIYSFIVYKSYYDNKTQDEDGYVLMREISYSYIQKCFGICKSCIVASMKKLKSFGLVKDDKVKISGLVESGYFKLYDTNPRIKGELLIFYSYIKHKSEYFGGSIDTYKKKLGEEMNNTKIGINNLLNRLYKLGLAERLPNGKLKVN